MRKVFQYNIIVLIEIHLCKVCTSLTHVCQGLLRINSNEESRDKVRLRSVNSHGETLTYIGKISLDRTYKVELKYSITILENSSPEFPFLCGLVVKLRPRISGGTVKLIKDTEMS